MGRRKYNFNQNYFSKIDTPNKAYILGFIGADGNNNRDGFRVELNSKDVDILHKIKKEIGECYFKEQGSRCGIWYYSVKMSRQLEKLGVLPNKTHLFDYINTDFERDFIRGYFDGDGSIHINKNYYDRASITITGNVLFINEVKAIIDNKFDLKGYVYCRKKETRNIITITYCGTKSCHKILEWLYKGSELYLDRKFNLYKEVCKTREKHIQKGLQIEKIKQEKKELDKEKIRKAELLEQKVISLLDDNYSIRQIHIQHGIDKRKIRRIIDSKGYEYPERRRTSPSKLE